MSIFHKVIIQPSEARVTSDTLSIRGKKIIGEISTFDIPKEARAEFDGAQKKFTCDLIYLTEEPLTHKSARLKAEKTVTFSFGKNSGKLYRIEIDGIERDQIPTIVIEVSSALESQISQQPHERFEEIPSILNLMSAKRALEKSQLFHLFSESNSIAGTSPS